ncbi:tRNA threonylcarbamoyladenosine biosynthesis protein TsaB [Ruaniaceae bacterium KH17]|nr:tRNA threonylcarbamoyladenosine biosynthesis protein TsaB [Ruaniaceae bacterium KH17]
MKWLAIDTSEGTSVAFVDGTAVERRANADSRGHAEHLAPMLAELPESDAIVVGTGPAPFTGLRVGIVTARALAAARGIPVVGVPSLDALARQALDAGAAEITVATDARRKEVFWASYRPLGADDVELIDPFAVAIPEDVAIRGTLVGAGARLYPEALPGRDLAVDPAVLARIATARWGAEQPTEPLYLRRPDIHASAGRKRAS